MKALIVVDVQNDFCPGGSLAVPEGDRVVPFINRIRQDYPLVVFTQDWHPAGHSSFASSHAGHHPFDVIQLGGQQQVLWPDHCVQGTEGAAFHADLDVRPEDPVFRKGDDPAIDSYSGFLDNDHKRETGLGNFLKEKQVTSVDIVGLATDVCVKFTALDALRLGFQTAVLREGCRGVNLDAGDVEAALQEVEQAGASLR